MRSKHWRSSEAPVVLEAPPRLRSTVNGTGLQYDLEPPTDCPCVHVSPIEQSLGCPQGKRQVPSIPPLTTPSVSTQIVPGTRSLHLAAVPSALRHVTLELVHD